MAVIERRETGIKPSVSARLRDGIVEEMGRAERLPRPPGGPIVIREESAGVPRYSRWYVIWDQFLGLDPELRSEVILDAVERKFGKKEVLRSSMVMGLTPDEPLAREVFPQESAKISQLAAVHEPRAKYRTKR